MDDQKALERLIALVPPPPDPLFALGSWEELFAELGTRLPADYVALIDAYGSVAFSEYLGVADARRDGNGATMGIHAREIGDSYRSFRAEWPADYRFAAWPEPGGFLPWGNTIDGDHLGWLTEGEPDRWPVAIWPRHSDERVIDLTMAEFLLGWFSGDLVDSELPDLAPVDCQPW
ncbi:hypothetical protein GCM10009555_080360 [Acrocarpospora macrocephala]|uniref:Knr4/Smi1-like domain-containing protein n=1 Tax=Acrocarpospora macrocephala TaxID=150177 RepID=A0A5M3WLN7_9ACTN|nr:SMI1/KNR4 family protein [Acrocarpospora macrocephala]GES10185.1 hypothetical protein Amac_037820 [Acrocarpospora macrocephala]